MGSPYSRAVAQFLSISLEAFRLLTWYATCPLKNLARDSGLLLKIWLEIQNLIQNF